MEEREQEDGPVTREQAAALGEEPPGEEDAQPEENTEEGTDSTMFDTSQHSDSPGPFGTD